MQSQTMKPTSSDQRKEYNRAYYLKNKQKLAEKKKLKEVAPLDELILNATSPAQPPRLSPWRFLRWLEILAFLILAIFMTVFLVKESANFYLDLNDGPFIAYLKAGIVEGVAVLFSFSRGKNKLIQWSQRLVVVLLCSLTLWTMSGRMIKTASQDTSKVKTITQMIRDLESEQQQKEHLRGELLAKGWIGATRKYEKGIDQIRQKLENLREQSSLLEAPHVIMNSLGILIAFRLLIVLSNLICIHRLAEQISIEMARKLRVSHPFWG
jgi:hypothetical protein